MTFLLLPGGIYEQVCHSQHPISEIDGLSRLAPSYRCLSIEGRISDLRKVGIGVIKGVDQGERVTGAGHGNVIKLPFFLGGIMTRTTGFP